MTIPYVPYIPPVVLDPRMRYAGATVPSVAENAATAQGMIPGPMAQGEAPAKPGLLDLLFPGGQNLDPASRKAARNQGLLQGGLALMAAAGGHGPREVRPNFGQSLFGALNIGQEAAKNQYEGYEQGAALKARQQMFASLGIGPKDDQATVMKKLEAGFMYALQTGDAKAATSISEVLKSMSQSSGKRLMSIIDKKTGMVTLVDASTGETVREMQMSPDAPGGNSRPVRAVAQADGSILYVNPYTGEVYSRVTGSPKKGLTETQAKAKAFVDFAQTAASRIADELGGATDLDKNLAALGGNGTISSLFRGEVSQVAARLAGAAGILAEAWLRMTTGAAYNETELASAKAMFTVLSTDDAKTVAQKMQNIRLLQGMLETVSGNPDAAAKMFGDAPPVGAAPVEEAAAPVGDPANIEVLLNGGS